MIHRHRQLALLVGLAVVALPAIGLRAVCAGNSCGEPAAPPVRIPFCSLPFALRDPLAAGFRDGRSPDVLAAPVNAEIWGGLDGEPGIAPAWPATSGIPRASVPLVFSGTGIRPGRPIPGGTTLASVAPTLGQLIGVDWQAPRVHPGDPVRSVVRGDRPTLVLEVAWKGIGSTDLAADRRAWPFLRSLWKGGAGSLEAATGSLPLDPAATLTTMGTGGLPQDHGITGINLRNEHGELTRAWGRAAPLSVISTLADDLDASQGDRPKVGLVGTDPSDRGLIGGDWYPGPNDDATAYTQATSQVDAARKILASGFGTDADTDLLAVAMRDSVARMDRQLEDIVALAERASGGHLTVVVAGSGSTTNTSGEEVPLARVLAPIEASVPGSAPVVEGAVAGGIFLEQDTLARANVTSNVAVQALKNERAPGGDPLMADAYPGFAVSFGKYCTQVEV